MDTRIKGALILGLVLVAVASALYIAPALANMKGDVDQAPDCSHQPLCILQTNS